MIKRILLLEDDEDDQLIFKTVLKQLSDDFECVIAVDGSKGLDYLLNLPSNGHLPELIFLDLNMPCMNGFEFLLSIKDHSRLNKIPIVILTTSENPEDKKKANMMGIDRFIIKSPDFISLKRNLSHVLKVEFEDLYK